MLALACFIPRLANHNKRVVAFTQSIRISFGKEHKHSNHLSNTSLPAQSSLPFCLQGFGFPLQIGSYLGKEITCLKSQVGKGVEQALDLPILCKHLLGSEESYLHSRTNAHRFKLGNKRRVSPIELLTMTPHSHLLLYLLRKAK